MTEWLPSAGARLIEKRLDATDIESCLEEEEPAQPTGHTGPSKLSEISSQLSEMHVVAVAATPGSGHRSKARADSISKTIAKGKRKQSKTIHQIDGRMSHVGGSSSGGSRGRR